MPSASRCGQFLKQAGRAVGADDDPVPRQGIFSQAAQPVFQMKATDRLDEVRRAGWAAVVQRAAIPGRIGEDRSHVSWTFPRAEMSAR